MTSGTICCTTKGGAKRCVLLEGVDILCTHILVAFSSSHHLICRITQWDEWLESASILKWTNELAQRVAKGGAVRRKDDGTGEPSSTTDSRREAVV